MGIQRNISSVRYDITQDRLICFGKYNGLTVNEVISKDPQYVEYMSIKYRGLFTDSELQKVRNLRNRQRNREIYWRGVRIRSCIEEEMYGIFGKQRKPRVRVI